MDKNPRHSNAKNNANAEFERRRKRRTVLLGVFFCLCLCGLLGRVGYIKYKWGDEYARRAVMQLVNLKNNTETEINPTRGYIIDRNKQPIAISSRVYNVILDVTMLDSRIVNLEEPEKDAKTVTLKTLSEVLAISPTELEALFAKDAEGKLLKPTKYHIVARKVPSATAAQLDNLRDVYLEDDTQRKYIDPYLAPQTVGFLRGDSSWGLESQYNEELVGVQGRVFNTYDKENNLDTVDIPARNGYTLVLTLDTGIQRIAQSIVESAAAQIECENAAMLVMDPYTGEVIAMAQWPSFSLAEPSNQELFTDKRLVSMWEALSEEDRLNRMFKLWGNFHTTHTFEPGSIFKPVVVAAALEENIIDPASFSTFCTGKMQIYDWNAPCWYEYGHGSQNVVEVLANSCNMGMIDIIQRMGKDLFYKYRNDFGYGERTGIDLPGEASVSSPAVMYPLSQLNPVELATSAMGQGSNNTAIQAITAFSAVINGGNVMKPYLVSQIVDEQGNIVKENSPVVVRKAISSATSDYMREAMHQVVTPEGTGKGAIIEGYNIGGKTGSAQQGKDRVQMTLSFMAYFPVENPEYIVLVVIDHPTDTKLTSGSSVAPMIRDALTRIIEYKNIPPSDEEAEIRALFEQQNDRSVLSDYNGMHLVDVTHHLNNLNIDYQVIGAGTVVDHHYPAAGQAAPKGVPIYLYMDAETQSDADMTIVPDVEKLELELGQGFIIDAHLTPISFHDENERSAGVSGGDPVTYNPSLDPVETTDTETPTQEEERQIIYKQYPLPGSYVPKGTEIKLKVKRDG